MNFIRQRKNAYRELLTLHYASQSGHLGSSLSCLDSIGTLYSYVLNKEDQFILSKGHAATSLYVILKMKHVLNEADYKTFHTDGTLLAAHPAANPQLGISFSTGSLGHGLGLAAGLALGYKMKQKKNRVYCLMSDGECNEGSVWEAAQFAVAKNLDNVTVLIDRNRLQAFGKTKDVLGDGASLEKWKSFGFITSVVDGHDVAGMKKALLQCADSKKPHPQAIILNTIKGKGVSVMQNKIEWHYAVMNETQYKKALLDIDKNI